MKSKKTARAPIAGTLSSPPPSPADASRIRAALAHWYGKAGRDLPWRHTHDPYAILVSEVMCQQTQVATVLPYYERWIARFPTFRDLARATEDEVLHAWAGLGYYSRARNLHRAAKRVVEMHGGELPARIDAAHGLPGVGRYTAGAVASFAFDFPAPIVDANIARVLSRLLDLQDPIDSAAGTRALWDTASALQPRTRGGRLHNSALMELGALVCTPRKPRCPLCPIRRGCASRDPESLPRKRPRRKTVATRETSLWIMRGEEVVLEQQLGRQWRGLWKLPRATERTDTLAARPLAQLTYAFTHHRVSLRVYPGRRRRLRPHEKWIRLDNLRSTALAAPHARVIATILEALKLPGFDAASS
jgi:A/G-specific adenine glycosylase